MALIEGLFKVIDYILNVYLIILFASGILRMVRADEGNPIVRSIHALTDPPCRWLLRRFPRLLIQTGGQHMDLSLFVLMVAIGCLRVFLPYFLNFIMGV